MAQTYGKLGRLLPVGDVWSGMRGMMGEVWRVRWVDDGAMGRAVVSNGQGRVGTRADEEPGMPLL